MPIWSWTPTDTTTVHGGYARLFLAAADQRWWRLFRHIALFDNNGTAAGDHTDDAAEASVPIRMILAVSQKRCSRVRDRWASITSFYRLSQHNLIR